MSARPRARNRSDAHSNDPYVAKGRDPIPGDLLLQPIALVALAVVIVNDRLLKVRFPGTISGKLSDFAGLIYFPLFMATIVEIARRLFRVRDWWATARLVGVLSAVTGVVFALAKIWTPWSEAYRTILGAIWWPADVVDALVRGKAVPDVGRLHLVQDHTDLVALPSLVVPVVVARLVTSRRIARSGDRPH